MKNQGIFFSQLYPEYGKNGYKEIYAILKTYFKREFLKKHPKKDIKKFFIAIANCTYFAYAVANYKTVKRPQPDPTSNPVATELKEYFGEFRTDRILLEYKSLYWAILRYYFKVDLQGDVKPYSEFLYPPTYDEMPSSSFDTQNRVRVSPGGPTNRYNKHIFH